MAYVTKRVFYIKKDDKDRKEKSQKFFLIPYMCLLCPSSKQRFIMNKAQKRAREELDISAFIMKQKLLWAYFLEQVPTRKMKCMARSKELTIVTKPKDKIKNEDYHTNSDEFEFLENDSVDEEQVYLDSPNKA